MVSEHPARHPQGEVAAQPSTPVPPVQVRSCSRLGLVANPPGLRLSLDWLRRR